eukprot:1813-Rhodomonas_salina.1
MVCACCPDPNARLRSHEGSKKLSYALRGAATRFALPVGPFAPGTNILMSQYRACLQNVTLSKSSQYWAWCSRRVGRSRIVPVSGDPLVVSPRPLPP